MKKLILIVILAVVASRAFSERDEHQTPNNWLIGQDSARIDSITQHPIGVQVDPNQTPEPPSSIRTIPWSKSGDGSSFAPEPPTAPRNRAKRRKPVPPVAPAPASKEAPAWFPKGEWEEEELARPDASGTRVLLGRLSVSEDRAKADLRKTLNHEVADWLAADVPMTWTPPSKLFDRMIKNTYVQTVTRSFQPKPGETTPAPTATPNAEVLPELDELYTLYRAGQKLDFSDARRADFIEHYRRDVASARMRRMGAVGAVVLAALAVISVYIRTDEATKGYYTNRLRVLAAAGLGAAGVVAYRYWA